MIHISSAAVIPSGVNEIHFPSGCKYPAPICKWGEPEGGPIADWIRIRSLWQGNQFIFHTFPKPFLLIANGNS